MKVNTVRLTLALFFTFPFLVLFYFFKINLNYNFDEIIWALKNSLFQSFMTSIVSIGLGYLAALGIAGTRGNVFRALKLLSLVPVFLPALFTVLIGLAVLPGFPRGNLGVIYILSFIYIGFSASVLTSEITTQLGKLGFVGEIYGLSKLTFHNKIIFPIVFRSSVFVFATIFVQALTAFTIPLLVGGGRGTNLEVLIYEKIFNEQDWSLAVSLSLLQLFLVALLTLLLRSRKDIGVAEFVPSKLVSFKMGLLGLVVYLGVYFWGYLKLIGWLSNIYYLTDIFNEGFYTAVGQSYIFFIFSLVLFFTLFSAVLYLRYRFESIHFLNFYLTPSSVMVGFSFYLLFPANQLTFDFFKLTMVFAVVVFVGFLKTFFENQIHLFENQMKVARAFGLSFLTFLFKIYIPQARKKLHEAASVLFIFCISEFGLVKVSGAGIKTLGTEMAGYLSSYRIEGAFVISLVILALWIGTTLTSGALLGVYKKS